MCNFISVLPELNLNCRRFFFEELLKSFSFSTFLLQGSVDSVSVFSRQDNILKNVRSMVASAQLRVTHSSGIVTLTLVTTHE